MLKQRIITALILVPLVAWGIYALPSMYFALFFGLISMVGVWEWTHLMQLHSAALRALYAVIAIGMLATIWFLLPRYSLLILVICSLASVWWLIAIYLTRTYQDSTRQSALLKGIIGLLILVPAWTALVYLQGHPAYGPRYVFFLLLLIWAADTGAYFSGRRWGKHKLAPRVSPGKTWEGVAGGMTLVVVVATMGATVMVGGNRDWQVVIALVALSMLVAAISVVGDLTESMYKREAGVKDSGRLLPGHGGVLDRIDSITAAAPVFVLGLWFFHREDVQQLARVVLW